MSIATDVLIAANYSAIQSDLTYALLRGQKSSQDLWDALYVVVLDDQVYPEVDLVNPFHNSYVQSMNVIASSPIGASVAQAIRAMNAHVITRSLGTYTTINDYFAANAGLTVYQSFASLSAGVGFTIEPAYIVADPII